MACPSLGRIGAADPLPLDDLDPELLPCRGPPLQGPAAAPSAIGYVAVDIVLSGRTCNCCRQMGREAAMRVRQLHPSFGVEVDDVDLRRVTATDGYAAIRAAFEAHSLLLFRDQHLDDAAHLALGALFGPIEDRSQGMDGPLPPLSNVANLLAARVLSSRGGETEFASTRAAWRALPEPLKATARTAVLRHRYAHSRAKVSAELARQAKFTKWPDQAWRAVWRNPVNGEDALYIASHAFAVDGLPEDEGQALIDELIAFATRPGAVYSHAWRPGDVLIWDERAVLHRGRPWPYAEERTLASICITARAVDGLDGMRP
jgi:alpha-ketoglutarate-dependent 2,4-dichlorophenoxyacetate dioxygenase